jgi:hypothetical protein
MAKCEARQMGNTEETVSDDRATADLVPEVKTAKKCMLQLIEQQPELEQVGVGSHENKVGPCFQRQLRKHESFDEHRSTLVFIWTCLRSQMSLQLSFCVQAGIRWPGHPANARLSLLSFRNDDEVD